jgi:hypothetical protein
MLAIGMSLWPCASPAPSAGPVRVVPVSTNEAFLVAPHASLGAVALHLIHGNGGDPATPADSVGAPFGGWRIRGFRVLPTVASDPRGVDAEIVSDGIGAQQIAIRRGTGGGWAGHYHGFGPAAVIAQDGPDLLQPGMLPAAQLSAAGRATWHDGAHFDFAETIALTPDGAIATIADVAMPSDPNIAYLDMTIVGQAFIRASLDGGTSWIDLLDLDPAFGTVQANVATVLLRNPVTGTTVTVTDDALDGTPGRSKMIMRRPGDFKIYADFNPLPAETPLGSVAVHRTITLGRTVPDPMVTLTGVAVSGMEGDSASVDFVFTVARSSASGATSVAWSFAPGDTSPGDFADDAYPAGGAVTLADGEASGTFALRVRGDGVAEVDETFTVSIRAPLGYAPGAAMSATGTVLNDDGAPVALWDGAIQGNAGYVATGWNPQMRSWDAATKQLVFSRGANPAGGNHRTLFALTGLVVGQAYTLVVSGQIAGASPSAGVMLGLSTDMANGASQASSITLNAAIAAGTQPVAFTAGAATMVLVVNQGPAAGSDNVFRLSSIGRPVPV